MASRRASRQRRPTPAPQVAARARPARRGRRPRWSAMFAFLKKFFRPSAAEPSAHAAVAAQHRAESELRESEQHFAQLVAGVRDYAVFLLDAEGRVRTWNAGAERIKGYAADEIIGHHFSRFYPNDA